MCASSSLDCMQSFRLQASQIIQRGLSWRGAERRTPSGSAPRGPRSVQGVPRQLLAGARRRARVSRRLRQGGDRGGISRGADPGGVRRRRPGYRRRRDHPRGDQPQRRQRRRLPCADVHDGYAAAPRLRGAEAGVPAEDRHRRAAAAGLRRHRADHRLRHDAVEDHGDADTATATSSAARKSGSRARSTRTCCCWSSAPRRSSR